MNSIGARRIVIDTDPGVDDCMAILLAFCSPELHIDALTTVFGNSGTTITTENALRLVEMSGRPNLIVARGAETPMMRPFTGEGWRVHGRNGLGGQNYPAPIIQADRQRAAEVIVKLVMSNPGEITIVALAPLTNIALAVMLEPLIATNIKELVLMGGAISVRGNASAVAEANFRNDPEAAAIVFSAAWPIVMVGLDVTLKTVMDDVFLSELKRSGGRYADLIFSITRHYMDYCRSQGLSAMPVHDPSAIAYVVDPSLFTSEPMFVDIEHQSPHHHGMSVADWRGQRGNKPNCRVCVDVDSVRLLSMFRDRLTIGKPP